LWCCYSCNLELCAMKTRNIEGTILSLFSNLCACRMPHRTWKCFVNKITIVGNNACLKKSSTMFYKQQWVGPPQWPNGSSDGGVGCLRIVADRARWEVFNISPFNVLIYKVCWIALHIGVNFFLWLMKLLDLVVRTFFIVILSKLTIKLCYSFLRNLQNQWKW